MDCLKLYELHVIGIFLYYVVDLQKGIYYPLRQFPPEFANMDLEYINAITEIIPAEDLPQSDIGHYYIRRKIWPFNGLTVSFMESDEHMLKRVRENDEWARQVACMVSHD